MSPEMYAIIGVGASLAGLMIGIGGLLLYFINQANRRIDDQGQRIDRMEGTLTQRTDRLEDTLTQRMERTEGTLTQRMDRIESTLTQRMERTEGTLTQRMDRIEGTLTQRIERLEAKFDQILEYVHSLDLRVAKLEWMLDAALYGKPVIFPQNAESDNDSADQVA